MKVRIELDIDPSELELANELVSTLRCIHGRPSCLQLLMFA